MPGSTTREDTYQDRESEEVRAAAAMTRSAMRRGKMPAAPAASAPMTAEALLAALPESLRAQVAAALAAQAAPTNPAVEASPVGTCVGTIENGPETPGP